MSESNYKHIQSLLFSSTNSTLYPTLILKHKKSQDFVILTFFTSINDNITTNTTVGTIANPLMSISIQDTVIVNTFSFIKGKLSWTRCSGLIFNLNFISENISSLCWKIDSIRGFYCRCLSSNNS